MRTMGLLLLGVVCALAATPALGYGRPVHESRDGYFFSGLYCKYSEDAKLVARSYATFGVLGAYGAGGSLCTFGMLKFSDIEFVAAFRDKIRVTVFEMKDSQPEDARYLVYPSELTGAE